MWVEAGVFSRWVEATPPPWPLGRGAALIAAEEDASVDVAATLGALDALAAGVDWDPWAPLEVRVERLVGALAGDAGLRGDEDTYEDPANSSLPAVLARRKGLPILLSVIYIEVARRLGFALDAVPFPGHFIVAPAEAKGRFFLDPFHGGQVLGAETLRAWAAQRNGGRPLDAAAWAAATAPADDRAVFIRMNLNLRAAHLKRDDPRRAAAAARRILALAPGDPGAALDFAQLVTAGGEPALGEALLGAFLDAHPNHPSAARVRAASRRPVGSA
jgi:regulator of sirC expression with transglutaminase-like and TPR domain